MIEQSEEELINDVARFRKKGDRWAEVRYLSLLGAKYKELRKLHKAVETWEEVVQIRLALGDSDYAASTLFSIANIYWAKPYYPIPGLGDINRAIAYAEQAVSLESRKRNKAEYLGNLSSWYAMIGNIERAIYCSDLSASYHEDYNIERKKRMQYIKEFAERGYV